MAQELKNLKPGKTYADAPRARHAVEALNTDARYTIVYNKEGRAYPIFTGQEALQDGVFHHGFIVIG